MTEKNMLKKLNNSDRGAAMIVVILTMTVVMIVCLVLIVGAYQMFATVNDEGRDEKYYQQAISFSETLRVKLTTDEGIDTAGAEEGVLVYISSLASDTDSEHLTETLNFSGEDGYDDIRLILTREKITATGCDLVIKADILDGNTVMASCTAKYKVSVSASAEGKLCKYVFYAYY